MNEVSADKGYLGADNMLATLRHGTIPYIPFKINSVAQSGWEPKSDTPQDRLLPLLHGEADNFLTMWNEVTDV